MAKRKAVKNIIYELENEDIEISSEDEVISPKVRRIEPHSQDKSNTIVIDSEPTVVEVLNVDSTDESICLFDSPKPTLNGGKSNSDAISVDSPDLTKDNSQDETENGSCTVKTNSDLISLNEDEDVEVSPSIAGCENRAPLVSVQFLNSNLSLSCRTQIKEFIIQLLIKHQTETPVNSNTDSSHELNIWPEDLVESYSTDYTRIEENQEAEKKQKIEESEGTSNSLFFVDTGSYDNSARDVVPKYRITSTITNVPIQEENPRQIYRRPLKCFNCDGAHNLKECKRPRNYDKIAIKRQQNIKIGRYHVEDDQKYGHLVPGRISGALRNALGLKRNEIPLHVYRMRILGYPPGWLEDARISHSGISMFDSTGAAVLDPEQEDGEICEAGSRDKYDIKKILDFPGFNVPASSRYTEDAYLYGLPPMSEQDSKIAMLQMLAPNAMKAYKRKKLTFFPSASHNSPNAVQVEMELDSGDEEAVFPSVPPLPDEAPPPPPPPPSQPPPPSPPAAEEAPAKPVEKTSDSDSNDLEIASVMQVSQIPIPEDSLIVIDECYDTEKADSARTSPTLDDLEKRKQILIDALEDDPSLAEPVEDSLQDDENIIANEQSDTNQVNAEEKEKSNIESKDDKINEFELIDDNASSSVNEDNNVEEIKAPLVPPTVSTPEPKTGYVKASSLGTPIMNIASPYVKLPSDDKFSKQICDVLNFENLPNSTGNYKKICKLLKKVKTEVDRIQDS